MKRLDIAWNAYRRQATYTFGIKYSGVVGIESYLDCVSDVIQAVYERLEERNIKLVGKCEVYCNGKLWEVVDNG